MKRIVCLLGAFFAIACSGPGQKSLPEEVTLSKEVLLDKIKGGWAGQTIGCTYGGPTEFRYAGSMIADYTQMPWPDGYIKQWFEKGPWLYDDVYMDLTFVTVFDRLGLDAPVDSLAMAFATADYELWHANQAARYNILHGIMPPASGHWLNNPHADDIDFQIEADFAGLMSPGMPNSASEVSDKIGHIMNCGDGWYGGVYMAAMYSLAFVSGDLEFVVTEALKTIPAQSRFYRCMSDVIRWHNEFPGDWKRTWFECERKWDEDYGCPEGTLHAYNIDAVINSAYVIIGLLYGEGDFYRTMDISTRCGQDSDCNPASAAGILGTMIGYSRIPEYWMKNLREVEDMPFAYGDVSLNKTYAMGMRQALQMIEGEGGKIEGEQVTIRCQKPTPVGYEKAFEGLYPVSNVRMRFQKSIPDTVSFEGTGFVAMGGIRCGDRSYVAELECYVDGELAETALLPANPLHRRIDLCWNYQLPKGKHNLRFHWKNPRPDATLRIEDLLIYSDAPKPIIHH